MKCNHCHAEWTANAAMSASFKSCPFCRKPITIDTANKLSSMRDVLKAIIAHRSIDGLKDGQRALAMFSDLAPHLRREKIMFSYFVQCNGQVTLLNALKESRHNQIISRSKVAQQMMLDFLVNEDIAYEACDAFWDAIGGHVFTEESFDKKERQVPSPEQNIAPGPIMPTNTSPMPLVTKQHNSLPLKSDDNITINWNNIDSYIENKTVINGTISECNPSGLIALSQDVQVFIPTSQSGIAKGNDPTEMIGQTVQMLIMETNRERQRAIGSIRAVTEAASRNVRDQIWTQIDIGKKYHGVVKSLSSYGAFVDIGGVEGFVHISDLSWYRIKSPSEVVRVGDDIDVYVISFNAEKGMISLGYRTSDMDPWHYFIKKYKAGDNVDAKIVKIMSFGAFAEILPGVDGLIHISQMSNRRNVKPEDILYEGLVVHAQIIDIDVSCKRISLSIRDPYTKETRK